VRGGQKEGRGGWRAGRGSLVEVLHGVQATDDLRHGRPLVRVRRPAVGPTDSAIQTGGVGVRRPHGGARILCGLCTWEHTAQRSVGKQPCGVGRTENGANAGFDYGQIQTCLISHQVQEEPPSERRTAGAPLTQHSHNPFFDLLLKRKGRSPVISCRIGGGRCRLWPTPLSLCLHCE